MSKPLLMAAALLFVIRSDRPPCATSAMPYILSNLLSALKRPVPSVPQALRVVNIDRKNTSSAGRSAGKARCSSRWTKVRCFDWDTPHPLGPATAPLVRPDFTPYVVARACSLSSGQGRVDESRGLRSEPAGRHVRLESRRWRGGGGTRADSAPARAAAVVVGGRVVAIGRGRERARADNVRASLNRANVGGFTRCVHTNRGFLRCIRPASAQRFETNYGFLIAAAAFKPGNAR